jgi:hypothetical protein
VIGFAGNANSGKTALIAALVRELRADGGRMFAAGAEAVAVCAPGATVVMRATAGEPSLDAIIAGMAEESALVCASMNAWSVQPLRMISCSRPLSTATFVPARGAMCTSAAFAGTVSRGSMTTSLGGFGPASRSRMRDQSTVCVAALLCPTSRIASVRS